MLGGMCGLMGCFNLQVPPNIGGMCGLMGCFGLQVVP